MKGSERIFIVGMGMISSVGCGVSQTLDSIRQPRRGIKPLTVFPAKKILPVGEVSNDCLQDIPVPRTHQLAITAAKEAIADFPPPEAVVLGCTTGGILTTENLLKKKQYQPELYTYHAISTVAELIARTFGCRGPVVSISTACSSGTAAICIAFDMLRSGKVKSVLAGGVDSLCRLTYYGFNSLQIVDPTGARPFDKHRRGMTVAEGSGMLYLISADSVPDGAVAEIIGSGLSCDAFHAAAPHPDGKGAYHAMTDAINDAGLSPKDITYINLHGTGTLDNDLSEAKAIRAIWGDSLPYVSSVKGAFGHSIAASGAVEAVITVLSISNGFIPSNEGFEEPDPGLGVFPVKTPIFGTSIDAALSNSFGFGGNNASIILSHPRNHRHQPIRHKDTSFSVIGSACITGAGTSANTLKLWSEGKSCHGTASMEELGKRLPAKLIRRAKRLPKLTLALAEAACPEPPFSIFFGTGWGALSETYDFLSQLFDSEERFVSPTDFIGSVHNAPAGLAAAMLNAPGPNITASVGNYSFDHALFIADTIIRDSEQSLLVMGADECHPVLSPLFDPSSAEKPPSDGGGALCLKRKPIPSSVKIQPLFFAYADNYPTVLPEMIKKLDIQIRESYDAVFVGIPAAFKRKSTDQLNEFKSLTGFRKPILDYRSQIGDFASASASACVIAVQCIRDGRIPAPVCAQTSDYRLVQNKILMLNLGEFVTALEVSG